jgi:hypothetical protein
MINSENQKNPKLNKGRRKIKRKFNQEKKIETKES